LANRQRGYVSIELDRLRKLRFDTNALAELEDAMGKPITQLTDANVGIKALRAMLWAGLLHESPDLTIKEAGQLMDYADMKEVAEKVTEAISLAFGDGTEKNKISGLSGTGAN
jgi:hypothetical protein